MSRGDVELVRRVFEALARADMETVFALVDPDVAWDFSHATTWPEERVYRGYAAIGDFFRTWLGEWDDYRFELEEVIDAGDRVVAIVRDEGRGKVSGIKLERRHGEVWTLREGRALRIELFDTREDALEAVDLRGRSSR
jgi:ketosteroid isomerase-like protein